MRPPNDILVFCCVALRFGYANYPVHGQSLVIARLCVTLLAVSTVFVKGALMIGGVTLFCTVLVEAGLWR